MTYVLVARVPADGVAAFRRYEELVLPALAEHGGRLERRLVSEDELVEVHIVWFPSAAAFAGYRDDPARAAHAELRVPHPETSAVFWRLQSSTGFLGVPMDHRPGSGVLDRAHIHRYGPGLRTRPAGFSLARTSQRSRARH